MGGFGESLMLLLTVMIWAIVILMFVSMWRLYDKAGEGGWKILIPIYNIYVLYRIAWGSGWKFLLTMIPFVGWFFGIMVYLKLANAFGRSTAFGIGLLLLPFVFIPILAFSDNVYLGPDD